MQSPNSSAPGTPQQYDQFEVPDRIADSAIDLRWLISTLWRRKWTLAICATVGLGLGMYNASQQEPIFGATATLLFEPERLQIVELADVLADQDTSAALANQLQIINSTSLLERVIDRLADHETDTPTETPSEEESPKDVPWELSEVLNDIRTRFFDYIPVVNEFLAQNEIQFQIPEPVENTEETTSEEPQISPDEQLENERAAALKSLRSNLNIQQISGSRVIEISYTGRDPEFAALLANTVGEEYIAFQQVLKNQDVTAVIDLMNIRIKDLRVQLQASEEALEKAQLELFERQPQSVEMTSIQLNALNQELAGIRLQLVAARARRERAETALKTEKDLWSVREFRESALIQDFRRRELELRERITEEEAITGQTLTPSKAVTSALMDRIYQGIREEAGYIVAALEFEVSSLERREVEMEGMIRNLEFVAIEQSSDALQTNRLEREVLANQTLYQSFVDRLKEVTEQANLQSADARFLSRAEVPSQPDRSQGTRLILIAGVIGGAIGLMIILFLEKTTNSFRTAGELAKATRLPVIGAVPQSGRRRNARDLSIRFSRTPRGLFSECIRNLRTSLLYSEPGNTPKVVMFTSSVPGEGKTSTSLLIGISSKQAMRKTIVVSCDLRDPKNAKTYSALSRENPNRKRPGLVTLLRGECEFEDALCVETKTGLHILAKHPSERLTESPADLLALPHFGALIERLRQEYDLIVLDTPPVLAVTDARLMARHSDTVVYMVHWAKTPRNAVLEGLREVRTMGVKVAGCAFTRVSLRKASQYSDNEFINRRSYAAYYR